jgi:MmgE/PrpD N-terminal domain
MFGQTDPKLHDVPIGIDATGQRKEFDSMGTVDVRSAHGEHSARTKSKKETKMAAKTLEPLLEARQVSTAPGVFDLVSAKYTDDKIAAFVADCTNEAVPPAVRELVAKHLLDSIGCAIGAIGAQVTDDIKAVVDAFGGKPICTLIGGGRTLAASVIART